MRALASFAMSGRSQAVMAATVLAILALIMPVFSILSSAVIGLVTLRKGQREGVLIGALSSVAAAVLAYLVLGSPAPVVGFMLALWLPVWILGGVLRSTLSLALTLVSALAFGLLLLIAVYISLGDPLVQWQAMLEPVSGSFVESGLLEQSQVPEFIALMASWITGILATGFVLQLVLALLLARAWQAGLFNPGGFREEFHGLNFGRYFGIASVVVLLFAALQTGVGGTLGRELAMLMVPLLLLQGLAVAHRTVAATQMSIGWLVGLYLLLFFAMPHAALMVGLLGLADIFVNFRGRLKTQNQPDP